MKCWFCEYKPPKKSPKGVIFTHMWGSHHDEMIKKTKCLRAKLVQQDELRWYRVIYKRAGTTTQEEELNLRAQNISAARNAAFSIIPSSAVILRCEETVERLVLGQEAVKSTPRREIQCFLLQIPHFTLLGFSFHW